MLKKFNSLIELSFLIYLLVLFFLLFGGDRGMYANLSMIEYALRQLNLIPFKTIGTYLYALLTGGMNPSIPLKNLCGNLLMFLPMGLYLPFFIRKVRNKKWYLLLMFVILLAVEVLQFISRKGAFDIDDFILNMLGAVLGFAIWKKGFSKL